MSLASDGRHRLRALLRRGRVEAELDEELRFHLEQETAARRRAGAGPEEARRQARVAFGGVEDVKEQVRDARGVRPLEDLIGDLRYAARGLRRSPVYALAAVTVLGLGIGAAAAAFSALDAVLLTALPYPEPDRLVAIFEQNSPTNRWTISVADLAGIAEDQHSFEAVGAVKLGDAEISGAGEPERARVGRATVGFFQALRNGVFRGRNPGPGDAAAAAPPVAIVSHALAARALGGADSAVGRTLAIDGLSHTVVGVLPPGVDRLAGLRAEAWVLFRPPPPTRRGPFGYHGLGRLRKGVSPAAAAADLAQVSARILPRWPDFPDRTARLTPVPLRTWVLGDAGRRLGLFAGAVALVLLIAVANVATLMLVRAAGRAPEMAVRRALGATQRRLVRLVVAEGLLVATLAGLLGLALASLGAGLVGSVAPRLPQVGEFALGARTVGFAAAVAGLCGLLVGLAPVAIIAAGRRAGSAAAAAGAIGAGEARVGTSRRTHTVRGALVVAEFALALPLLLGTGLLLTSFLRLRQVDPGYDPSGVASVSLSLPAARYPDAAAALRFWRQAEARVREVPGVTAVGLASAVPPDGQGDTNNFDLEAHRVPPGGAQPVAPWSVASTGFFAALGVPLLAGRVFTEADDADAPPVAIVSASWAARYLPDGPVVGQRLIAGGDAENPLTIVGVVGDVKYEGLGGGGEGVYQPVDQWTRSSLSLVVRTRGAPDLTMPAVRAALRGLDPRIPVTYQTMEERLATSLADPRRWTAVLGAFAAVAAVLAALGIFGLMSYAVRQRRREIGVRMAFGADPASVTRMIVGRGMRYALLGIGIGALVALAGAHWLRAFLFEVAPTDPLAAGAAAGLLLLAAAVACWIPGRRAARLRPLAALDTE